MTDGVESFLASVNEAVSEPGRVAAVRRTGLLDTVPEPSFDTLTAAAASLLGTEFAFLTLVDDRRSFWKSAVGVSSDVLSERENPVEESFCQYVIGLDSSFAVSDARADPRTRGNPSVDQMGVIAWAGEPVRAQDGSVVGSFCVMAGQPREWSGTDLEILKVLASSASREVQLWTQVLEYDLLRRRAEALASLTARLGGDLTTEEAIGVVVEYAPIVLAADFAIVGLLDPSGMHVRVTGPPSLPHEASEPFAVLSVDESTPLTDAIRSGRLVVDTDEQARHEYPLLQCAREMAGVKTSGAAPLRVSSGAIIGAFGVAWERHVVLDPVGRSLLSAIASLCSQTIERTWLNDTSKELITALTLQLFPTVPEMPRLDLAATYRPSDDRLSFGGDWYDAIALDDERILVIVGDVAGHGVPAAAMMSQIRVVLNTLAQQDTPLGQLVPAAESLLWQFNGQYLATLALIEIDFANECLSHVSAGHPPLLVRAADGTVTRFGGGRRPPLGIGGTAEPTTVPFPPGSTVVAYTDGLVERRDVPIDQGIDTLAETLRTVGSDDAHTVCEAIIGTVLASSPRQDDIATVVITHLGPTPPLR